jgi:hypothetical protein
VSVAAIPTGFEAVTIARLDKARADWIGQSIREFVAKLDRSSGRDHERLVSLLINHELALRAADRAEAWDGAVSRRPSGKQELIESIASARAGLDEAVRSAGLADDLASARGYLGLSHEAGNRPPARIPEPIVPCRIRAFGRPSAMIGTAKGLAEPSAHRGLTFVGAARDGSLEVGADRSVILAAALAVAAILSTSLDGRRARLAAAVSLVVMLALSALAGGPVMLAGGLGLAAVALQSDRWTVVSEDQLRSGQ